MKNKKSLGFTRMLIVSVFTLLIVGGLFFSAELGESATSTVTVTATVGSSITCSSSGSPDFSSLTTGGISEASVRSTTTFSCNSSPGCNITVSSTALSGVAGLASTTANDIIESQSTTLTNATLIAGTDGYGMQVTTPSAGSGATLSILARWAQTGNAVGFLSSTAIQVASAATPFASRELSQLHKAAVGALTIATNYTETLTYTCTSN